MAANHRSTKHTTLAFPVVTEYRLKLLPQSKSFAATPSRSTACQLPKTSAFYPTVLTRSSTPHFSNRPARTGSARTPDPKPTAVSSAQQQQPAVTNSPPPHPHYGHFLAYLRRQSLARLRRRHEQQELDNADSPENATKPASQSFQSASSMSLATLASEICAMPVLQPASRQRPRDTPTSYRPLQRASSLIPTNYRLSFRQAAPLRRLVSEEAAEATHLLAAPKPDTLTPANSLVDEAHAASAHATRYEVNCSGDMLSYCYISDSGVTYKGQMLSTIVQ